MGWPAGGNTEKGLLPQEEEKDRSPLDAPPLLGKRQTGRQTAENAVPGEFYGQRHSRIYKGLSPGIPPEMCQDPAFQSQPFGTDSKK